MSKWMALLFFVTFAQNVLAHDCKHYLEKLRTDTPPSSAELHRLSLEFAMISDVIRDASNIKPKDFDPNVVLKKHGIDTDKMTFRTYEGQMMGFPQRQLVKISLGYPFDSPAGHIHIEKVTLAGKDYYQTTNVRVREDIRNKGAGTMLYLAAASEAQSRGASLISTPNKFNPAHYSWLERGHQPEAEKAWVGLVKNGYASELRTQNGPTTMIYYVMTSKYFNELIKPTKNFYEAHQNKD
jgi:GNAT superfamily N-acetyltransferase